MVREWPTKQTHKQTNKQREMEWTGNGLEIEHNLCTTDGVLYQSVSLLHNPVICVSEAYNMFSSKTDLFTEFQ
jgi:hypothetical protein